MFAPSHLASGMVELIVCPPTLLANSVGFAKDFVQSTLKRPNRFPHIDLSEELANIGGVRLDETKIPIRVLLVVTASDPQGEVLINHIDSPTPILRTRFL